MRSPSPAIRRLLIILAVIAAACPGRDADAAEPAFSIDWTSFHRPGSPSGDLRDRLCLIQGTLLAFPTAGLDSTVSALEDPAGPWRPLRSPDDARWPQILGRIQGQAALITCGNRLVCAGGASSETPEDQVFIIELQAGAIVVGELPSLPQSASGICGAALGQVVYLAARVESDGQVRNAFWSLDLADHERPATWRVLPTWPNSHQSTTALVSQSDSILLFAGASGNEADPHVPSWRFTQRLGWKPIANSPWPLRTPVAAPVGPSHVLVRNAESETPGALYHTITDTWQPVDVPGETQELIAWQGRFVAADSSGIWLGSIKPDRSFGKLTLLDYSFLVGYLVILAAIGTHFARHRGGTMDFFLGGQRIPWWVAGISLFSSSISAISFLAIPALVYRTNWVYLLGNIMIITVAPVIVRYYLPFYRRLNVTSAYEYLECRFGLAARLLGSFCFLLLQMSRIGIIIYMPALAISAVTGWNVYIGIVAVGLLVTVYTCAGGIQAVIWIDMLQVLVLVGGAVVSLFVILTNLFDSPLDVYQQALSAGKLQAVELTWDAARAGLWVVVVGNFFKFLIPHSSDQAIVQHYLTTRDERQAARSIWLNAASCVPIWLVFFMLGTSLWAFYRAHPERLNPIGKSDEIFAWFIVHELPVGAVGLVLAGLLAASMSALDGGLNSMATVLTTDFYRRFRPETPDRACVRIAQFATAVFGMTGTSMALYMAYSDLESIWDQWMKIVGLFGSGLAGMFVAGIFTRRIQQAGVLIGFAVSGATLAYANATGAVHFFLYGAIGILVCPLVGWAISFLLPKSAKNLDGLTIHSLSPDTGVIHQASVPRAEMEGA